ncbi:MAG: ceramidase domain-containing protein [Chitinophagales bacterium]
MNKRSSVFIIPIVVAVFSLVFVFLGIFNVWFGEAREGVMLYCEHARDGWIKQPSNTFSNLGFIAIGIFIGRLSFKNKFSFKNKMTTTLFYPTFFASVVVFLGPGSMAMHATNAYWGGFIDLMSMFLISSFILTYGLVRWFRMSNTAFAVIYFVSIVICGWVYLSPWNIIDFPIKITEIIFGVQILIGTVLELCNRYIRGNKINAFKGYLSLFTFCLAFFIWIISRTQESWFCNPNSLIQGHAIWHLLNALATYFLFLYYASEEAG